MNKRREISTASSPPPHPPPPLPLIQGRSEKASNQSSIKGLLNNLLMTKKNYPNKKKNHYNIVIDNNIKEFNRLYKERRGNDTTSSKDINIVKID